MTIFQFVDNAGKIYDCIQALDLTEAMDYAAAHDDLAGCQIIERGQAKFADWILN